MTINITLDTSVLIKGFVNPRRRIKDEHYEEYLKLHLKSRDVLSNVENGNYINHIPVMALIETACVVSRLTNDPESVTLALDFLNQHSRLYSDVDLLELSIEIGRRTKASGFDVIFMACADASNSILMTDDRKMYERAIEYGLDARFLREDFKP